MTDNPKLSALERYRREAQLLKDMQESLKLEGYEHKDGGWILSYDDMTSIAVRIADLKSGKERLDAELSNQRTLTSQYREMAEERLGQVKRLEEVAEDVRKAAHELINSIPVGSGTGKQQIQLINSLSMLEAGKPEAPKCGTCGGDGNSYVGDCRCGHTVEQHSYENGPLKPWCNECVCKSYIGQPCPTCHGTGSATGEAR